jgi:signal transduction histidine kinase
MNLNPVIAHDGRHSAMALATLSHELKTPLVALLGFAQLLEADARQPLATAQRERAERIEQASREMLNVVNDLLGRARRGELGAANWKS